MDDRISLLGQAAVDVPERLGSTAEHVLTLQSALRQRIGIVDEAAEQFQERAQDLLADYAALEQEAQQAGEELDAELSEVEAELRELAAAWTEQQSTAVDRAEALQQALEAAAGQIDELTERVRDAVVQARESLTALDEQAQQAIPTLSAAHESVGQQLAGCERLIEEAQDGCNQALNEFNAAAQSQQAGLEGKLDDLFGKFDSAGQAFEVALGSLHTELLTGKINAALDDVETDIEGKLTQLLDQALDGLAATLRGLQDKTEESCKETNGLRSEIEPLIEELEGLVQPLLDTIANAQRALNYVSF